MSAPFFLKILTFAFMCVTAISLSAYIPQVLASLKSKQVREGTVLMTWWIWTTGSLIEMAYMALVVKSMLLVGIASVHLIACGIVAMAATLERYGVLYQDKIEGVKTT